MKKIDTLHKQIEQAEKQIDRKEREIINLELIVHQLNDQLKAEKERIYYE